jgi:hypothetical protein
MQEPNTQEQVFADGEQWTTWGEVPATRGSGGRKAAAVLIPVAALIVLGLAAVAFVLVATPVGAAAGCGGG